MANELKIEHIENETKSTPWLLFFIGRLFTSLADQFLLFVVPLIIYKMTGSVAQSGLAFGLEMLPRVLISPLAGVFSDRLPLIRTIQIVNGLRAALCFTFLFFMWQIPSLPMVPFIIGFSMVMGMGYTMCFIGTETMLPKVFGKEQYSRISAVAQSIEQTSVILGPIFAVAILEWQNWQVVLSGSGLLFLIGTIAIYWWQRDIHLPSQAEVPNLKSTLKDFQVGFSHILNNRSLQQIVLLTALVNLTFGVILATGAAIVTGTFAMEERYFGILQSTGALTSIIVLSITAIVVKRIPITMVGIISYVMICLGGVMAGFAQNYWFFVVAAAMVLGFDGMFSIYIRTRRVAIIPPEDQGKTIGLMIVMNNISLPISGLLVTGLSGILEVRQIVLTLAVVTIVGGVGVLLLFKRWNNAMNTVPA